MEANRSKPDQEYLSLKKTYEKNRIMLGEDAKETLTSLDSLADYYDRAGDYDEAVELGEELLSKRTDLFGEDHEATIETSLRLAGYHAHRRDFPIALRLAKHAYKKRVAKNGEADPQVAG